MAEICCGVASDSDASTQCETSSRVARRRRMEIRRFRFVAGVATETAVEGNKRRKVKVHTASSPGNDQNSALENGERRIVVKVENGIPGRTLNMLLTSGISKNNMDRDLYPRYGVASVCGRRRDMEDAVAVHPSFFRKDQESSAKLHYFGVYDGHGCSHVAARCRERLHELVREELRESSQETPALSAEVAAGEWKNAMERSFRRMDQEVIEWNEGVVAAKCRCEMQTPECNAVGSTAVVAIVTPDKIIVANCGDSRAVLSRNGKPIPLSSDHKPDRPDELNRIQAAGGRVIFWDSPRVLGVLAMSRAIGDNYLKPYVSCEPEVTVTERTADDDCLILASDGLWDVVSNNTACGVARMCLKGKGQMVTQEAQSCSPPENEEVVGGELSDKACSDASTLLTKLALARHSSDNVSVVVVDLRRDT